MLPLTLLKTANRHAVLIELKNGETYNGRMLNCDSWMNIHLDEVICTSKDGDRFWKMPEAYIRGNTIKYVRVPDEVIDKVQEQNIKPSKEDKRPATRGGRGGRGWAVGGREGGGGGRDGGRGRGDAGRSRGRDGGRGRGRG